MERRKILNAPQTQHFGVLDQAEQDVEDSILRFFLLGARGGGVNKMEYFTVFLIVIPCAVTSCMIATVSSSAGNFAIPGGTTENDAKYCELFHFIDTPPCAKKEKPKYKDETK